MPVEHRFPLFYLRGASGEGYSIPLELDTAQALGAPLFDSREAADIFRTNQPATDFVTRAILDEASFVHFLRRLQSVGVVLLMLNPTGRIYGGDVETITMEEMLQRFKGL